MICSKKRTLAQSAYFCAITELLDKECTHLQKNTDNNLRHYLLDVRETKKNTFAIRIHGCTIGCIIFEAGTLKVAHVSVDQLRINAGDYAKSINDDLKKYVGEELVLEG